MSKSLKVFEFLLSPMYYLKHIVNILHIVDYTGKRHITGIIGTKWITDIISLLLFSETLDQSLLTSSNRIPQGHF